MVAISYKIFDDLLIGNFMKTTLHNCNSLYQDYGNFNFNVAKFADNGLAETNLELKAYLNEYKKRAGIEFIIDLFADGGHSFLVSYLKRDANLFKKIKSFYYYVR
jgi:hypothetical protein